MEWNTKTSPVWDWENLELFSVKLSETPRSTQHSEWMVEGGAGFSKGHVHPSGSGAYSGSEAINGCSLNISTSASTNSFSKPRCKTSDLHSEAGDGLSKNLSKTKKLSRVHETGAPAALVSEAGSSEPLIGLKLGKRTYFEDVCSGSNIKSSTSSSSATPSTASPNISKPPRQNVRISYCQVEGCGVDLSETKDYHRKHRVCERHSKCPKVIVAGQERRFCQQCSRFHELCEFDQKKRSCRRRLSDHNARRRKPQPETISFNSSRLSSLFYDDSQQMNLLLTRAPFGHIRPSTNSTWVGSWDFKLNQTKEAWMKSSKAGEIDGRPQCPRVDLSNTVSAFEPDSDRLLSFKTTTDGVLDQGLEAPVVASNLNSAPDLRRALSLLSNNSMSSAQSGPASSLVHYVNRNHPGVSQTAMHALSTTPDYLQYEQPLTQQSRVLPFDMHSNVGQFQECQLLKSTYETAFFDSGQIH